MSRPIPPSPAPTPIALLGVAAALALTGGGCAPRAARPATLTAAPPAWSHPKDWKTERLPFPLDFAPGIKHVGVEDLRFAPGFFAPAAAGYFSYAFVWWLKEREPQSAALLAAELNQYYVGLCTAVGEKKFTFNPARYHVELTDAAQTLPGWAAMSGQAALYDAFTSGQPLLLHLRAYQRDCPGSGYRAVLVLASPQPESAPIWTELAARAAAVPCP